MRVVPRQFQVFYQRFEFFYCFLQLLILGGDMELVFNTLLNMSDSQKLNDVPVDVVGHSSSPVSTSSTQLTNLEVYWLPETINKTDICTQALNTVDDINVATNETKVQTIIVEDDVTRSHKKVSKTTISKRPSKSGEKRPVAEITSTQKCRKKFTEQIEYLRDNLIPSNRRKITKKEKELERVNGWIAGLDMKQLDMEVTEPTNKFLEDLESAEREINFVKLRNKWNKGYQKELENYEGLQRAYLKYLKIEIEEKRKNGENIRLRKTGILNIDLGFIEENEKHL